MKDNDKKIRSTSRTEDDWKHWEALKRDGEEVAKYRNRNTRTSIS